MTRRWNIPLSGGSLQFGRPYRLYLISRDGIVCVFTSYHQSQKVNRLEMGRIVSTKSPDPNLAITKKNHQKTMKNPHGLKHTENHPEITRKWLEGSTGDDWRPDLAPQEHPFAHPLEHLQLGAYQEPQWTVGLDTKIQIRNARESIGKINYFIHIWDMYLNVCYLQVIYLNEVCVYIYICIIIYTRNWVPLHSPNIQKAFGHQTRFKSCSPGRNRGAKYPDA